MPLEFSAGTIIFRKEKGETYYLIIKYGYDGYKHWDLVKGIIGDEKKGEKALEAAVREAKEETGIKDLKFVEGFKHKLHYFFRKKGKTYFKQVTFFLAYGLSSHSLYVFSRSFPLSAYPLSGN